MAGFSSGTVYFDSYLFTTSNGDNDNVNINGSLLYVNVSNNNDAITGIVNPDIELGSLVFLVNIGPTNNLLIKHNDVGSDPENRILISDGEDQVLAPFQTLLLGYDTTNHEWHAINFPASHILPVADGTYTIGAKLTGGGVNGTITTEHGVIIAIQEAT